MSGSRNWIVSAAAMVALMLTWAGMPNRVKAQEPRVIEITAKRYEFTPNTVTLKKGETVKLRLHSEDVIHGFFSRPLKLDETIEPGKTVDVVVTPQAAGMFKTICDHF